MKASQPKILLLGYGNPGRLDDGLGPELAERIEKKNLPNVTVDADYQLMVEDAAVIAENDIVIFADAAVDGDGPFYFKPVIGKNEMSFSSHSAEPEQLVALAEKLFGAKTKCYILGIRGYEFNEFGQRLCDRAKTNLEKADEFITRAITENDFELKNK
ncbi:MAG: hydrogenase maturation protease [Anaerohalosphaeraceae bacterium]|nr:hydrogenase maturation protease [Anaerohalosphaeraceae bacterium]